MEQQVPAGAGTALPFSLRRRQVGSGNSHREESSMADDTAVSDSLVVVWTAGDREVARKMAFMYTKNSRLKDWWGRVRLVVWGPSAQLLAVDRGLQEELEDLKAARVELLACMACADLYGVTDALRALGVEVIFMGNPLTEMLKSGWTYPTV
jgi:hypothetical protein